MIAAEWADFLEEITANEPCQYIDCTMHNEYGQSIQLFATAGISPWPWGS